MHGILLQKKNHPLIEDCLLLMVEGSGLALIRQELDVIKDDPVLTSQTLFGYGGALHPRINIVLNQAVYWRTKGFNS